MFKKVSYLILIIFLLSIFLIPTNTFSTISTSYSMNTKATRTSVGVSYSYSIQKIDLTNVDQVSIAYTGSIGYNGGGDSDYIKVELGLSTSVTSDATFYSGATTNSVSETKNGQSKSMNGTLQIDTSAITGTYYIKAIITHAVHEDPGLSSVGLASTSITLTYNDEVQGNTATFNTNAYRNSVGVSYAVSTTKIDVTAVKTLKVSYYGGIGYNGGGYSDYIQVIAGLSSTATNDGNITLLQQSASVQKAGASRTLSGTFTFDVSGLTGKYYLKALVRHAVYEDPIYSSIGLSSVTITITYKTEPIFLVHPVDTTIEAGAGNVVFSANARNATSYQWYKNSVLIPGATGTEYSYIPPYSENGAQFYCIATNDTASTQSNTATLTFTDSTAPIIDLETTASEDETEETTVIVVATENGSGLADQAFAISKLGEEPTNWQTSNIFVINKNDSYTFHVRDKANNVGVASLNVTNIKTLEEQGLKRYYIMENGNLVDSKDKISSGIADLEIDFKGNGATGGEIIVDEDNNVVSAIMIIGKYTITYDGSKYTIDSKKPVITVTDNIMTASNDNGISYYQITTEDKEPLDWINVDSVDELEVDLRILNLSEGDYYIWAKSSTGVVSYPYEITIE